MTTTEAESSLTAEQLQALTEEMNAWMQATGRKLFPAAKTDELLEIGCLRCNRCYRVKPVRGFNRDRSKRTGYEGRCQTCNIDKCRTYTAENAAREQARWARYYRENREERLYYDKDRYWNSEHYRLYHQLLTGRQRAERMGNRAGQISSADLLEHWEGLGIDPLRCYLKGRG